MTVLASSDIIHHVTDHPWAGWEVDVLGMRVTLMSSAIGSMLLVGIGLLAVLIPLVRRWRPVPHGGPAVLEFAVLFVRNFIARPALHDRATQYLPYLLTLFVFILGMNLIGLLPIEPLAGLLLPGYPIGVTPTGVLTICAALAATTLLAILLSGMWRQGKRWYVRRGWPLPPFAPEVPLHRRALLWAVVVVGHLVAMLLGPLLWMRGLSPSIPGVAGKILSPVLMLLEVIGMVAKCFSLMVRLFANIAAGHILLAVLMYLLMTTLRNALTHASYVGPIIILGSAAIYVLELMVALIQAYIFTFLTAMFLGLYVETEH